MEIWMSDGKIYFKDDKMKSLGYTEYDEKLFEKINKVKWSVLKGRYLYSSALKKSLHQLVMIHWYGEKAFADSRKNNFIIDHHNNEGFDCQISNLSFTPDRINKSKAFTYDQDRVDIMTRMAVNFFKDFETGRYQITIGFNKPHYLITPAQNKAIDVSAIFLLYNDDFYRTMSDATTLLHEIRAYGQIKLSNLRFEKMNFEETILVELEAGKEDALFFELDGKLAMRLGTERAIINAISPDRALYSTNEDE